MTALLGKELKRDMGGNMSKLVYMNGNTKVYLDLNNGTRIMETEEDEFDLEYPVNVDIKLTNKCLVGGCSYCHENSTPNGEQADFDVVLAVLKSFKRGTEIALGGGQLTSIRFIEFYDFLKGVKELGLVPNATFHYKEIIDYYRDIKKLQMNNLLYGIGISIPEDLTENDYKELAECCEGINNIVFHVIAGLTSSKTLNLLIKYFDNPKLLILGYKTKPNSRGEILYFSKHSDIDKKIKGMSNSINDIMNAFSVVSFDDLALEQLDMKNKVSANDWDKYYQGNDYSTGMYIDFVSQEFARNSTSMNRRPLMTDVKVMFKITKSEVI